MLSANRARLMDSCHVSIGIFIDCLTQAGLLIKKKKKSYCGHDIKHMYVFAVNQVDKKMVKVCLCYLGRCLHEKIFYLNLFLEESSGFGFNFRNWL